MKLDKIIEELNNANIIYLDFDGYDTEDDMEHPHTPVTNNIFNEIHNEIIIPFIKKMNLDIENSDLSVNYIGKNPENGQYYISWYNPENVTIYLKDMTEMKPEELPDAFKQYMNHGLKL